MDSSEQLRNFCIFFIIGFFIGFMFDIFKGFRKNFKLRNFIVDLQDILFLILSGLLFFKSVVTFCNGDLRLYIIFASIIGITIYSLTISESCVIITSVIFKLFKIIFKAIWKFIKLPIIIAKKKNSLKTRKE